MTATAEMTATRYVGNQAGDLNALDGLMISMAPKIPEHRLLGLGVVAATSGKTGAVTLSALLTSRSEVSRVETGPPCRNRPGRALVAPAGTGTTILARARARSGTPNRKTTT